MEIQTFKITSENGLTALELLGCLEDTIGYSELEIEEL